MPFKKTWKSPVTGHEQRVYDELYVSDTWNQAQDNIMKQRRDDECKLERVIAGLMFWSDSTRLAQFGHASAWPVYLFFGNLSKYDRANPQSGCCHPIAFIPSVSFLVLSFFLTLCFSGHALKFSSYFPAARVNQELHIVNLHQETQPRLIDSLQMRSYSCCLENITQ